MSDDVEYEIAYEIRRKLPTDDDFIEIGFGISGAWSTVDQACHMVETDIQRRVWETEAGMPAPEEVDQ